MNKILSKRNFSANVVELVIEAPRIAAARRAGHFVIVRVDAHGERMPLTISDADIEKGTITLVVQQIGVSSAKLCALNVGDSVADVVGPLGKATHIENYGTVVCACGGVGAAPMLPLAQALKKAGNRVITVLAARTKELIILEEQLAAYSDELIIMTDDGSYGKQGLVTQGIEEVIQREPVHKCVTIGPAIMMKFVSLLTKKYNVPTEASLNTIMVDGTGMCGACRVTVGGKTRFVCIDGPEFDAHQVDFDEMLKRLGGYKEQEKEAYERYAVETPSHGVSEGQSFRTSELQNFQTSVLPDNWRSFLKASLKPKDRTAIPRAKMPELDPVYRATTIHEEVNQGLTAEQAKREAQRCLDCPKPTCVQGCPVNIDIPTFIKHIEAGDPLGAARVLKESSTLPAVCGRVCPQEKQCESQCIHLKMGHEPVAIGYLERFAADTANQTQAPSNSPIEGERGKSSDALLTSEHGQVSPLYGGTEGGLGLVAVVGSGPAGLTFAGDMAKYGYEVTVFEALHEIGGVLKYGIPEYRLPNRIVDIEIDSLRQMGVHFVTDTIIGKTITMEQLLAEGYKGIFVASGAGLPRFMNIEGENLIGVLSSNEYLTRVNLMDASNPETDTPVPYGKNVAVIGGGNTAMDAVRTAKRMGAEHAMIVYRRSEEEMPARVEEVRHAKEEGVEFLTLHNPIAYSGDEAGHVRKMTLQVMELGEPDESGRCAPVAVEGKTIEVDVDLVIVAIGVAPNPIIPDTVEGLDISKKGTIVVNDQMQSSIPVLYAGGDIVRGGSTVILAMSDGRVAAKNMHEMLSK